LVLFIEVRELALQSVDGRLLGQNVRDIFEGFATIFAGDALEGTFVTFGDFLGVSRWRGDSCKRFYVVLFDGVRDGGAGAGSLGRDGCVRGASIERPEDICYL
jgi:hypothetical protein